MFQKSTSYNIIRRLLLFILVAFASFPIFFLLISSIKQPSEIFHFPPSLFFKPTIENFQDLVRDWPLFFKALGNSLLISIGASLLTILVAVPAGYALSRHRNRFLEGSAFFMLAVRMFPPIVLTVPLFPVMSKLGLVDTYWILILLYATFYISLSTWLMKTYIDEVPIELEEAAELDGAGFFQRLQKIVLPLSIHGIIATAVFVTIFVWKEYMIAYIFSGVKVRTTPLVLAEMLSPVTGVTWGPLFAASTCQLIPIMVFVWLVQGYLVKGLKTGGVKG